MPDKSTMDLKTLISLSRVVKLSFQKPGTGRVFGVGCKLLATISMALVVACGSKPDENTRIRSNLEFATSLGAVGITDQSLEDRLGAPLYKQDYGNGRAGWGYEIDQCQIEFGMDKGLVATINVRLQGECRPWFRDVPALAGVTLIPDIVFGDVARAIKGDWRANCLGQCVVSPTMGYFTFGDANVRFVQTALQADPQSSQGAASTWANALRRENGVVTDGALPANAYACGTGAQATAANAMRAVPVHIVSVGYQLAPSINLRCDLGRSKPVGYYFNRESAR